MAINLKELELARQSYDLLNKQFTALKNLNKELFSLVEIGIKTQATRIGVGVEFIALICSSKSHQNEILSSLTLELSEKAQISYDEMATNIHLYCELFVLRSNAFNYAYCSGN
jgi:hypothetical protein|nr:MAG TPA: hypothetical protein [Ackermannviridae sp.]